MYFEQFYLGCLAHASYLLASEGEAVVVDPQRDVELYLTAAAQHGVTIRHIFESHLHADFVSGHKELAARTGAKIYIGAQAGATFPHVPVRVVTSKGFSTTVVEGRGTELSEGGMVLYAGILLNPGDLLEIEFETPTPSRMTAVVRSRNGFCFGLEFITPLPS